MAKTSVPNCETCGKAPDIMILWLKSGDTEWSCTACHAMQIVTLVAEQTQLPEEVAAG